MSDRPNTPVPDELYAVRTEIKRLTERETELKRLLVENPDLREGASYLAEVKITRQSRTDLKEMRHFHADLVDEFTFSFETTRVTLLGVTSDGEIVPVKKLLRDEAV